VKGAGGRFLHGVNPPTEVVRTALLLETCLQSKLITMKFLYTELHSIKGSMLVHSLKSPYFLDLTSKYSPH